MNRVRADAPQGRPLVALALVAVGWLVLRTGGWIAADLPQTAPLLAATDAPDADRGGDAVQPALPRSPIVSEPSRLAAAPWLARRSDAVDRSSRPPARLPVRPPVRPAVAARPADTAPAAPPQSLMARVTATAAAPQAGPPETVAAPAQPSLAQPPRAGRWSADSWLLLRPGGAGGPLAAVLPSYGRSQAGAVLRYRLQPGKAHDPLAYLRLSTALSGGREQELAGGLALRPLPRLPVRAGAELRVTRTAGGTRLRPALLAVTEIPPLLLPLGLRAETYVQGGYVGGAFATPFADGQLRVERPLPLAPRTTLDLGLGAWGGVQKGAGRLDVGPAIAVSAPLGSGRVRVAADYRWRVAGDAQPGSGPAITISSGF